MVSCLVVIFRTNEQNNSYVTQAFKMALIVRNLVFRGNSTGTGARLRSSWQEHSELPLVLTHAHRAPCLEKQSQDGGNAGNNRNPTMATPRKVRGI